MQNLTKPTGNQDALNRFYQHFIVEKNPRCVASLGGCLYRSEDGKNGCAIGCMIPDSLYVKVFDDKIGSFGNFFDSGNQNIIKVKEILEWFSKCDKSFLRELQHLHDFYLGSRSFDADLSDLADRYNLINPANV